jgi:pyruvate/2-oxoacid:ferredoxin oxidoreductase beta subunit
LHAGRLPALICWLQGGDGWAYDIGFASLDHVLNGSEDACHYLLTLTLHAR